MISLINHDSSEGEQWGCYNLPIYIYIIYLYICIIYHHIYLCMYIYIHIYILHDITPIVKSLSHWWNASSETRFSSMELPLAMVAMAHSYGWEKWWISRTSKWSVIFHVPSGKLTVCYWKWPFIVDFPINSMVIFHSYVSLPEGNSWILNNIGLMLKVF